MLCYRLSIALLCLTIAAPACLSGAPEDPPGSVFADTGPISTDDPLACECAIPALVDLQCVRGVSEDGACSTRPITSGKPCRDGVGVCSLGVCSTGKPWPAFAEPCASALDCDDGNPCTLDLCPSPHCDTCHHRPIAAEEDPSCVEGRATP